MGSEMRNRELRDRLSYMSESYASWMPDMRAATARVRWTKSPPRGKY